ncbi:MAG: multicopper oxidase domain-containing protein [Gemmatimonadetes bacterium]|nr:multicopper oxidase domain-containing protein [Gemmatimonadota bacterium]
MLACPIGRAWWPLMALLLPGGAGLAAQGGGSRAVLAHAPAVPPALARRPPGRVVVRLETREVKHQLADGVDYTAWTFGGQVPGQFIRVREGDRVEFHLDNHPDSRMPHNIDLNAVTGPGGGAAVSFTAPGHSTSFEFQARNPGLFVYHCAAVPVGMHVANGMYGLMLVEPAGGLAPARREYYLMLGEFYTDGAFGEPGARAFSWEKALAETPDYVVFNGAVGSLTGERALVASVGETVRLYVGNGGPNLTASFHISGETFDRVYLGGSSQPLTNVETVPLPPGSAAIVEREPLAPSGWTGRPPPRSTPAGPATRSTCSRGPPRRSCRPCGIPRAAPRPWPSRWRPAAGSSPRPVRRATSPTAAVFPAPSRRSPAPTSSTPTCAARWALSSTGCRDPWW